MNATNTFDLTFTARDVSMLSAQIVDGPIPSLYLPTGLKRLADGGR